MGVMDGQVVIVTGGGRGIGRDVALISAAEGAKVLVNRGQQRVADAEIHEHSHRDEHTGHGQRERQGEPDADRERAHDPVWRR